MTTPVLTPLDGKVVFVTGAGNGLGRAISRQSAAAGARVVATAPGDDVEETAELIRAGGGEVTTARVDATVASQVRAAVELARTTYGGLDAMVHNATSLQSSQIGVLEDVGGESWDDHLAVSVRGAYLTAQAAYPLLRQRGGKLLLFTSPAAFEGSKLLPAYGAVKGALRGMVKALATEWGPSGVGVLCLSPLAVTPALALGFKSDPELEARMMAATPIGRMGDPDTDIAPAVVFLLSDAARYMTGSTVVVDGGRCTIL